MFVAEIGDVHRFARPGQLASWAGLTPKHYESDTTVHRGRITKQGSRLVRWAAVEAVQHAPAGTPMKQVRDRIVARRGKDARNIATVAAARELVEMVFYALRDHHVRRLAGRHRQRDHQGLAVGAGRTCHDPHHVAWSPLLIDPADRCSVAPHSMPPRRGEGMTDTQ